MDEQLTRCVDADGNAEVAWHCPATYREHELCAKLAAAEAKVRELGEEATENRRDLRATLDREARVRLECEEVMRKFCEPEARALRLVPLPPLQLTESQSVTALRLINAEFQKKVDALTAANAALEEKLAEAAKPCEWPEDEWDGETVESSCGWCGYWEGSNPDFCPGCGHPVVVKKGAEHGE